MKRRWLALVLVVCMLAASAPAAVADAWSYDAETTLFGSSDNKRSNLELAVAALDGTEVRFGESFSFNETVGPRDREAGYLSARNGRGSRVIGGGVSQLATTLYLAARDCEYIVFEEFDTYNERFTDWYVEDGEDAVVTDYSSDKDFAFTSWYDGVLYISAWMDEEAVYCTLELLDDAYSSEDNLIADSYTPLYGSENKLHNIALAAEAIDGVQLSFGEKFSFNEIVGPRSAEAGFLNALNGRGAKVRGGGVAQVASTIYLAVEELDCISMEKVRTYGDRFTDGYVDDPADAIVTDYSSGYDLAFTYWGYGTMTIYVYDNGDELICEVYED